MDSRSDSNHAVGEPTVRNVEYPVVMKVIDILGNDTTKTLTVEIKSAKHLSS